MQQYTTKRKVLHYEAGTSVAIITDQKTKEPLRGAKTPSMVMVQPKGFPGVGFFIDEADLIAA